MRRMVKKGLIERVVVEANHVRKVFEAEGSAGIFKEQPERPGWSSEDSKGGGSGRWGQRGHGQHHGPLLESNFYSTSDGKRGCGMTRSGASFIYRFILISGWRENRRAARMKKSRMVSSIIWANGKGGSMDGNEKWSYSECIWKIVLT